MLTACEMCHSPHFRLPMPFKRVREWRGVNVCRECFSVSYALESWTPEERARLASVVLDVNDPGGRW